MKVSRYNVFIDRGNSVIVYNTLFGNFLILDRRSASLLSDGQVEPCLYEDKPFYRVFLENKMIIEDDVDEVALAQRDYEIATCDDTSFELIILPTLACNFCCWYCYESHQDTHVLDENVICRIKALVRRVCSSDSLRTLVVSLFGGEPLLAYRQSVIPLLKSSLDIANEYGKDLICMMTTNGSLLTKSRIKELKSLRLSSLQITLDGNQEEHNKVRCSKSIRDSYTSIVVNVREAVKQGIYVCLRLNISEETNIRVDELLNEFQDLSAKQKSLLSFNVQKVWQSDESIQEEVNIICSQIKQKGFQVQNVYTTPNSIWRVCYADKKNQIVVSPKGEVFKCTARDFTEEHVEGHLCNEGVVDWLKLHENRRASTPFNHKACQQCSIMPICIGGCSQILMEHQDTDTCPLHYTSEDKEKYAFMVLSEAVESSNSNKI